MVGQVLALDQSTSATKALLFDTDGRLLRKESVEHRQIYPQAGWVEHDAREIWRNTLNVLRAVADHAHPVCLSITNQRETILVFDRATGEPLHHAIVWQCRRGQPLCVQLRDAGYDQTVTHKTGLKIDTYFSASKLTWLMRHDPALPHKLATGEALIGTVDTYLIYRLTRGGTFATDHTNACRTLLFDIHTLQWDEQLCDIFGVPMNALPKTCDSTATFGETDLDGALKKPIPICGVMGDSQASLFAHRCYQPGMAKITLGSGSSLLLNLGPQAKHAGEGLVTTVAWTHQGNAVYSFEGIINYAAATVGWLKDQLGLITDPRETESAATAVKDNAGVYLVPAFAGLSAPYWSPDARAAIVGMTAHANRHHIIRAALESIAYQLRDVLDMMKDRAGVNLQTINADGGPTHNRFLMQFIADMTGITVNAAQMPDCSSLGAAMAGMLGMRTHASLEALARLPREGVMYHPRMDDTIRRQYYTGWRRAVKQVLAGTSP